MIISPTILYHLERCTCSHLTATVLCLNISGHGEACAHEILGVVHRRLQQVFEEFILGHLLITLLPPLSHLLMQRQPRQWLMSLNPPQQMCMS